MPEADGRSTFDGDEPMITIDWAETTHYQARISVAEARELLINEYRDDLRLTRSPDEIAELLTELDLDDHLAACKSDAWHDYPEHDIHWIKPAESAGIHGAVSEMR